MCQYMFLEPNRQECRILPFDKLVHFHNLWDGKTWMGFLTSIRLSFFSSKMRKLLQPLFWLWDTVSEALIYFSHILGIQQIWRAFLLLFINKMVFQRRKRKLPSRGSRHSSWRRYPYSAAWSRSTSWIYENVGNEISRKETP